MQWKRRITDTLRTLLLFSLAAPLWAADNAQQSHQSIREAAVAHVEAHRAQFLGHIDVTALPLDRRLRLQRCDQALDTYNSPNGLKPGRSVVGVRCDGSQPWKIYVPVKIAVMQTVVVSKRPLSKGQQIIADDLSVIERDVSRLHKRYFTRPDALLGMRSKRQIAAGKILTANMLAANQLIKRGGLVEILSRQGSLEVRMKGKALESAGQGQTVSVKNLSSGKTISGLVIGPGIVLVQ